MTATQLGTTFGLFALGTAPAELANYPLPGLVLLVEPATLATLFVVLPEPGRGQAAGTASLPLAVPAGARGFGFYAQMFLLDPAGPGGVAASNGLLLQIGS
jgi:hypothetical protein